MNCPYQTDNSNVSNNDHNNNGYFERPNRAGPKRLQIL